MQSGIEISLLNQATASQHTSAMFQIGGLAKCAILKSNQSKSTSRFVAKTSAIVASVVILTLVIALGMLNRTTDSVNHLSAVREQSRFSRAIDNEVDAVKGELAMLASGRSTRDFGREEPLERDINRDFERYAWSHFGFSSAYLIDAKGQVITGQEQGSRAGQTAFDGLVPLLYSLLKNALTENGRILSDGRALLMSPGHEIELGAARLLHDGNRALIAVVLPLRRKSNAEGSYASGPLLAVAVKELTAATLSGLALRHGIDRFEITRELNGNTPSAIALKDGTDTTKAYLRWTPQRPGDPLFAMSVPVFSAAIAFIVLMLAWVFWNLRGVAAEIGRREEIAGQLVHLDELSGLHNRRSFEVLRAENLARIKDNGGSVALLMLDLDKFKPVNDLHGHKVGDELIRAVSQRLLEQVRDTDCVARLGGDEFAIIQNDMQTPRDAAQLGQRILDALNKPFDINGVEVSIGVSIGIALSPCDTDEKETLLRLADTALYRAKSEGRNRVCFFERDMDRSVQMSRIVADDLRQAIENDQLVLHYQPQVSSDGTRVSGVEALVRWQHPVHGMIPPVDFISIAEQRGLIVPLSQWVLRRACLDAQRWPSLRLAVNVSPIDFRNPEFVRNVDRIIKETGFDASRLELELTEGVVVEDADAAERAMIELRALGIGLALDDFGTGYSSLIYLRRFAFDKIKIDRSFLEYMETTGESAILVHSVVHLGRALGLRVCAEGVETAEQHRFLQAVGCHELQGYFFSRPIPADKMDSYLATLAGGTDRAETISGDTAAAA
jgi:diguanylate cyclase